MKKHWKNVVLTVLAAMMLAGFAFLVTAPAADEDILAGYTEETGDDLSFLLD